MNSQIKLPQGAQHQDVPRRRGRGQRGQLSFSLSSNIDSTRFDFLSVYEYSPVNLVAVFGVDVAVEFLVEFFCHHQLVRKH